MRSSITEHSFRGIATSALRSAMSPVQCVTPVSGRSSEDIAVEPSEVLVCASPAGAPLIRISDSERFA